MPVTERALRENGFRQVRSERHAYQLTRWWLKHLAKNQQRQQPERCMFDLLAIKPGAWFKIVHGSQGRKAIVTWRGEVEITTTRQSNGTNGQ